MAGQVEKYTGFLKRLLPNGKAWELIKEDKLIAALSYEICRVDDQITELLTDLFPTSTNNFIVDWETLVGIPDECTPDTPLSIEERRAAVLQKLTTIGSLSAAYYESVGALYGYDIDVKNYVSFKAGKAVAGDAITNYDNPRDVFRAGQNVAGDQLQVPGWLFYFNVALPATAVTYFMAGINTAGDPLSLFENPVLECVIKRLKPAHSGVVFTFK